MIKHLCLIFVLCKIGCYGIDKELGKSESSSNNNDFLNSENGSIKYDTYIEEYIGNPDFDARIERPCRVFDLNCIRKYFAEHSLCKIRRGPLPRNLVFSHQTLYYSRVNVSDTKVNFEIGGFRNTRIEEFYINRRTNKIVFSIQIRGLSKVSPSDYFAIYRNGREPFVVLTEAIDILFPSVTYTAIIPNIDDIQLKKAEITGYADIAPLYAISPDYLNNPEPVVVETLAEFLPDPQTITQELILTDSYYLLPAYIQFNICDFGLNIS